MGKFDPVQNWVDNVAYAHSKSENTATRYKHSIGLFCDFIGKTPEQILEEYEETTDREFRRKYARFVRALIGHLSHEGYVVGSVKTFVAAVRSFFKYNDLPLGHVPIPRMKITYHNRDIAKVEIVEILKLSRPRDRAFFCMMAQSGQRPFTLCKLRRKHIEPDFSKEIIPCRVEIPEELAKGQFGAYFTFIGEESVKHLRDYFKTRGNVDPEDYLFTLHGSDKKMNGKSMAHIFRRVLLNLKQTGVIDFEQKKKGKPSDVRLYNLRKWFRNHAGQAGIEYVNFWMGHRADYKAPHIPSSDDHYFSREDVEFQRSLYREKAMPHLRLETATPSETEQTIEELRRRLESRDREVEELKLRLDKYTLSESQVSELLRRIERLEKQAQKQK
ncbi:MAG: hypothetical protein JSV12_01335 [Candidatus Bathyarchaeota archaeon]|nr:MAG: hypothetical protein JSV12_01335 [Candidatus Bathyarchaeota archaeon]